MYSFIRPIEHLLAPSAQHQSSQDDADTLDEKDVIFTNMEGELEKIREVLKQTWTICLDQKSRRQVLKRLLLLWHPDKHVAENKEFCTRVFQYIMKYVELLEQGVQTESHATKHSQYSQFFTDAYTRGRDYAQRPSGTSASSTSFPSNRGARRHESKASTSYQSSANPQPAEGRRWLRQAKHDLKAARILLISQDASVCNWVCYSAHQVHFHSCTE